MTNEFFSIESKINIDSAYKKAEELLASESNSIKIEDFKDIYSEKKIEKDKKYVEDLENEFANNNNQQENEAARKAFVLEYIIYLQGEINEWFGEGVLTIKTCKVDDIKNGVDLVVEFENEKGKYLGLAVDISFGNELSKKMGRIKSEIDKGELGKVEYFQSRHSEKKALINLARVVIAFTSKTTDDLVQLWLEEENEKLGNHPAQFQIIIEILLQLKKFKQYAREVKENENITQVYDDIINIFQRIKNEKKKIFTSTQDEYLDEGYDHIDSALAIFEHEINKNIKVETSEEAKERLYKKFPYLKKKKTS